MELTKTDLHFVVSRLPKDVRELLMQKPLILGGGFIRATIASEKPSDIDLFGHSESSLEDWANSLVAGRDGAKKVRTPNAITVYQRPRLPVQFITRWLFDDPMKVAESFDFTIAQAVIWYDGLTPEWHSWICDGFYPDLAARRLVYTFPKRNEDASGSLLRVRKFLTRGYNIQLAAFAGVIARLISALRVDKLDINEEQASSRVLEGLLREVDPLTIVDGIQRIVTLLSVAPQ